MNVIFALFLLAGIYSATNLKTYEQAKNFSNPENTQSSFEEYLKKKRLTFTGMCSFSILNLCHR